MFLEEVKEEEAVESEKDEQSGEGPEEGSE